MTYGRGKFWKSGGCRGRLRLPARIKAKAANKASATPDGAQPWSAVPRHATAGLATALAGGRCSCAGRAEIRAHRRFVRERWARTPIHNSSFPRSTRHGLPARRLRPLPKAVARPACAHDVAPHSKVAPRLSVPSGLKVVSSRHVPQLHRDATGQTAGRKTAAGTFRRSGADCSHVA